MQEPVGIVELPGQARPAAQGGGQMVNQVPLGVGMEVFGVDGKFVGRIKAVGPDEFLIDRTLRPDIRVPRSAVLEVIGGRVSLTVPAHEAAALEGA